MSIERVEASLIDLTETVIEFKVETSRILGRIEASCEHNGLALNSLEDRVTEVEVDTKVAQKVGAVQGRRWGAAVGVVVSGIFEGLRQWFQ